MTWLSMVASAPASLDPHYVTAVVVVLAIVFVAFSAIEIARIDDFPSVQKNVRALVGFVFVAISAVRAATLNANPIATARVLDREAVLDEFTPAF